MRVIIMLLFCSLSSNVFADGVEAPFGLKWGQTQAELKSKKVRLTKCKPQGALTLCMTDNPIKKVSFGEIYHLVFDRKEGLVKVVLSSKSFDSDIYGIDGKKTYNKVKTSLNKKYGNGSNYEWSGRKLYKDRDEFYLCLKYEGCGAWASSWKINGGGTIFLELNGLSRTKGYLSISYESMTWTKVLNRIQNQNLAKDEDAL